MTSFMKINAEASFYIRRTDKTARFPNISRKLSIQFIDALYKQGAMSVEVHEIRANLNQRYITELVVRYQCPETTPKLLSYLRRAEPTTTAVDVREVRATFKSHIITVQWKMEPIAKDDE